MTRIDDNQLNNILDRYQTDETVTRLSRLEDAIMDRVDLEFAPLFAPMNWRDRVITGIGVCCIAFGAVVISQLVQDSTSVSLLASTTYHYGSY